MDNAHDTIRTLLEHAGLGQPDVVRYLGQGVHNDGYYVKAGEHEYCVRIARYTGKRGLIREADALRRLPVGIAPVLIYFSGKTEPIDHLWSIASFISGVQPKRLTLPQLRSLGSKLAQVHAVPAPAHDVVDVGEVTGNKTHLWEYLLWSCRSFYTPGQKLADPRLARLLPHVKTWFDDIQKKLDPDAAKYLLHKDIGVGNLITQGGEVFLIDWEDREFGDPMSDFATGFWDVRAAGRSILDADERTALYDGYAQGGGVVDVARIQMWVTFDKLVVALFFCNRIYTPKDDTNPAQQADYRKNLDAIITSLNTQFI